LRVPPVIRSAASGGGRLVEIATTA
jgi:hypothetical protein